MYCRYLIMITSIQWWRIVCVSTIMVCWSGCCFQYQLVFSCKEQIYCSLTTNLPAEITCPSIFVLFCSMYASERNWMIQNPIFVVSLVLMEPYIPDWTNEAIFSLIPSWTTWCISSNASEGIDFGVRWMIFQLLYGPRTGQ